MTRGDRISEPTASPRWTPWVAPVVIVLAIVFAYHNALGGPFIFDDYDFMLKDTSLQKLWPPTREGQGARRPVGKFTLAINYALAAPTPEKPLSPWGFKLGNVIIHALASLTLYGIVRRTLRTPRLAPRFGDAAEWLAGITALLWAVHPLHTQAVTYAIQRFESLMGLFYMLTLYAFIRAATSDRRAGLVGWSCVAVLASALGMGTKEVMATAPVLVILYDRCFIAGSFREALRRRCAVHLAIAATWGVIAGLVLLDVLYPTVVATSGFGIQSVKPLEYALSQPGVILHYLRLAAWPRPLVLDYLWPIARTPAEIVPPLIAILVLLAATCWALVRHPPLGFMGAWFFGILSVTSSVVPIADLAMEHRVYLSLASVIALVVIAVKLSIDRFARNAASHVRLTLASLLSAAAVSVAMAVLTTERNEDYDSAKAIWSDTVAKRPGNWRAHRNLAAALADDFDYENAEKHYRASLDIFPNDADGRRLHAQVLLFLNRPEDAAKEFQAAYSLRPDDPMIAMPLGETLARLGRLPEAARVFEAVIAKHPADADAVSALGNVELIRGDAAAAVASQRRALAIRPDSAEFKRRLAASLVKVAKSGSREADEAVRLAREANETLRGSSPIALDTLADALASAGDTKGAADALLRAIMILERRNAKTPARMLAAKRDALLKLESHSPETHPANAP